VITVRGIKQLLALLSIFIMIAAQVYATGTATFPSTHILDGHTAFSFAGYGPEIWGSVPPDAASRAVLGLRTTVFNPVESAWVCDETAYGLTNPPSENSGATHEAAASCFTTETPSPNSIGVGLIAGIPTSVTVMADSTDPAGDIKIFKTTATGLVGSVKIDLGTIFGATPEIIKKVAINPDIKYSPGGEFWFAFEAADTDSGKDFGGVCWGDFTGFTSCKAGDDIVGGGNVDFNDLTLISTSFGGVENFRINSPIQQSQITGDAVVAFTVKPVVGFEYTAVYQFDDVPAIPTVWSNKLSNLGADVLSSDIVFDIVTGNVAVFTRNGFAGAETVGFNGYTPGGAPAMGGSLAYGILGARIPGGVNPVAAFGTTAQNGFVGFDGFLVAAQFLRGGKSAFSVIAINGVTGAVNVTNLTLSDPLADISPTDVEIIQVNFNGGLISFRKSCGLVRATSNFLTSVTSVITATVISSTCIAEFGESALSVNPVLSNSVTTIFNYLTLATVATQTGAFWYEISGFTTPWIPVGLLGVDKSSATSHSLGVWAVSNTVGVLISGSTFTEIFDLDPSQVPEFSLTTLLLAVLVAGGLMIFVIRKRKN